MLYGYGILNNHVPTLRAAMRGGSGLALLTSLYAVYKAESNANDSLGNYNGTAQGGLTYSAGKSGNAFNFNGTTAYVNMGDVMDVRLSSWTYSCWFNANATTDYTQLFSKTIASSRVGRVLCYFLGGKLVFFCEPQSFTNIQVANTTTISTNTWYHVALVLDRADKLKIYLNGTLEEGASSGNNLIPFASVDLNNTCSFRIGSGTDIDNTTAIRFFNGKIDEFNVWNRVLTTTEITELYNSGTGKFYPY